MEQSTVVRHHKDCGRAKLTTYRVAAAPYPSCTLAPDSRYRTPLLYQAASPTRAAAAFFLSALLNEGEIVEQIEVQLDG